MKFAAIPVRFKFQTLLLKKLTSENISASCNRKSPCMPVSTSPRISELNTICSGNSSCKNLVIEREACLLMQYAESPGKVRKAAREEKFRTRALSTISPDKPHVKIAGAIAFTVKLPKRVSGLKLLTAWKGVKIPAVFTTAAIFSSKN